VTDHELVERARDGDSSAFGELVVRHHRAALRAAMAALGSGSAADDAVQEAWVTARAKLAEYRGEASFRTWVLAIVWHKALDHRRSLVRWLHRQVSFDDAVAVAGGGTNVEGRTFTAVSSAISPEASLLHEELQRTVHRLIAALPSNLRDPLLLVASGEYTYEEVASMLGRPVGTVKWRVSEARRQVKTKLARLGFRDRS
jgi:RNA polymerase sigma-70 factor, ECF subfamily